MRNQKNANRNNDDLINNEYSSLVVWGHADFDLIDRNDAANCCVPLNLSGEDRAEIKSEKMINYCVRQIRLG